MKSTILALPAAIALLCLPVATYAKPVKTINSYGIYVAAKSGYVKLASFDHMGRFVSFEYMHEVPSVIRAGTPSPQSRSWSGR